MTKQTKGMKIIGDFNSENLNEVDLIKKKAIELIDLIEEHGKCERRKDSAFTAIEYGTMMGIKSIFMVD